MKEENSVRRDAALLGGYCGEAPHRWFPVLEGDGACETGEKGFGGLLNLDSLVVT